MLITSERYGANAMGLEPQDASAWKRFDLIGSRRCHWQNGGRHNSAMAGLPDFNSSEEKRARFGKVFAPRVEKLIEDLQAVAKTANLEIYEFDDALVKKLFVELARRFRLTAHRFGIEFEISVEGEQVE